MTDFSAHPEPAEGSAHPEPVEGPGVRLLAGALVLGALAVALLLFGRSSERGRFAEAYSTFRAGPEGAKAAYLVLERLGFKVARHVEEAAALDGVDVLFCLEPAPLHGRTFDEDELEALARFVQRGGCLVLASSRATELHDRFHVKLAGAADPQDPLAAPGGGPKPAKAPRPAAARIPSLSRDETAPAVPSPYAPGGAALAPDRHGRMLEPRSPAAVPIFRRKGPAGGAGTIEAVAVREGEGKAIIFADPSPFANRALGRDGNAAVLAAIAAAHARSGTVAFDEVHHGFSASRGIAGYLGRRSLAPALIQAALAFAVLTLALSGRRPRPPVQDDERPPESREHVRALAEIYAKARLRKHCADRLERAIVRDVEAALGTPPGTPPDGIAEALRLRGVKAFRGLEQIARRQKRVAAFREHELPEHELVVLAHEVARFEADCRAALGKRFGEI